mmetsp:Transcript_3070/g.9131  ORF Transcript_3070/g.9131 Transcript_3070/m.9131 type:complete len:517 (+) Transcript_3070:654-2204(+)
MRYCVVNKEGARPAATNRSKSDSPRPPRSASRLRTVGGSCAGSPTNTNCVQPGAHANGTSAAGSVACAASSTRTIPNSSSAAVCAFARPSVRNGARSSQPAPTHDATTTSASNRARRRRARRVSALARSSPGCARRAAAASSVQFRRLSRVAAGWPTRTADTFNANVASNKLSAATLETAHARARRRPRPVPLLPASRSRKRTAAASAAAAVLVFPVPGGPWTNDTRDVSALVAAVIWASTRNGATSATARLADASAGVLRQRPPARAAASSLTSEPAAGGVSLGLSASRPRRRRASPPRPTSTRARLNAARAARRASALSSTPEATRRPRLGLGRPRSRSRSASARRRRRPCGRTTRPRSIGLSGGRRAALSPRCPPRSPSRGRRRRGARPASTPCPRPTWAARPRRSSACRRRRGRGRRRRSGGASGAPEARACPPSEARGARPVARRASSGAASALNPTPRGPLVRVACRPRSPGARARSPPPPCARALGVRLAARRTASRRRASPRISRLGL